jgi:hypothetical protein
MKLINNWAVIGIFGMSLLIAACSKDDEIPEPMVDENFDLITTSAIYNDDLEQIEMTIQVVGLAGATIPSPVGQLDGAPVLGYVFPTNLNSNDVGFGNTEGIVAMALTSHPDFDDTPLWDENNDQDYENDGAVWHSHWVLLVEDTRVEGGLSVKQFEMGDPDMELPPTNPGMPMYMDSPGYQVITEGNTITVVIPSAFVNQKKNFNFDAVAARMQVNTSNSDLPMLGVYEVYEILSEDLSLPYQVQ